MDLMSLMVIAVGLAADAFAAAFGLGLCSSRKEVPSRALICGGIFGLFQAAMPLLGYLLAALIGESVKKYDHWIAFVLLSYIGITMIIEAAGELKKHKKQGDVCEEKDKWSLKSVLLLGLATSIDAFAAGVSLAILGADIFYSAGLIGVVTFILSAIGLWAGNSLGGPLRGYAGICGGVLLVGMGVRTLLEHLFLGG